MSENGHRTANWAILALTLISVLALGAGVVALVAYQEVGAVLAVVTGAVGGIVAIVLKQTQNGGNT